MYDVISIGSATIDIFVKSKDFINKNNLLSLKSSSKNEINQYLFCSGGGATNSAVAFKRLGLKSICVSLLGNSYLNNYILDDLKKNKIPNNFLSYEKSEITDFSVILVAPDGSRSILTNRGKTSLQEKHFKWSQLKKTNWFYISSLEGNLDLLEEIIGFAHEFNIKIALNPGRRELRQTQKINSLVKLVDVLLLNKEEAENLIGLPFDNKNFFNKINSLKIPQTAITDGRYGAYVITLEKQFYSPIIKTNTIDETGAGDSFGSAFVAATIYHKNAKDALFWGIKNSASVVSSLGAKAGLLTLKQIRN